MPDSVDIPLVEWACCADRPNRQSSRQNEGLIEFCCLYHTPKVCLWSGDDDAINMLQRAQKASSWELMQILWTSDSRDIESRAPSNCNLPSQRARSRWNIRPLKSRTPKPRPNHVH